jgi:integrase
VPRKPTPRLRRQTGRYLTTVNGEQHKLSTDKAEAEKAFHELMARGTAPDPNDTGPRPSLKHLVGLYPDQARLTEVPETYEVQRRYLVGFCRFVGNRKARYVRVTHVKDWVAADHPRRAGRKTVTGKWGESTRAVATSTVVALFNWAVEEQRLAASPIKGIKRGRFKRRGRILPPEHKAKLLEAADAHLCDFLTLLSLTGARPFSEIGKLTAAGIDWENGLVLPAEHKTEKKGKSRVIVLVPEAVAILKRLAEVHPHGLLVRTRRGNSWTRQVMNLAMRRAARRAGLPPYTSYDLRRTFLPAGLARGLSANVMARLAGNTPGTINKHYDSLHLRLDALKAAAKTVAG